MSESLIIKSFHPSLWDSSYCDACAHFWHQRRVVASHLYRLMLGQRRSSEKWRHPWYFLRDFYPYEEASNQVAMSAAFRSKILQLTPVDLFTQNPLELIWISTNGLWHTVLEIVMLVSEIMHVWCIPQRCVPHPARTEAPACAGTSVCVPLAGLELVATQVHAAGPRTQTIKELDSVTSRL